MKVRIAFVCASLLLFAGIAFAATLPTSRAVFRGDASTYNPNYAGWKTGGQGLATGGRYDANDWAAALQLGLAKQYRCGYGAGKICYAVVQEPKGRAAIVKINDNGPLVPGRVIDLNEKSMQYLSYGKYGKNSGVIKNVTVGLLEGQQKLGPVDEKDAAEWAKNVINTPTTSSGSGFASPQQPSVQPPFTSWLSQPTQQPQAAAPQQSGSVQPGQYFSNAYTPIPANQPFPYTNQASNGNTNSNTGGSVASSLLDLIKPVTFTPASPQVSLSSATSGTVVTIQPQGGTQVVSVNPPTETRLNPSQTFVQASLPTEQQGTTFDTAALGRMLETLKSALLRILEIVRLR